MKSQDPDMVQIASGTGIAQATNGATASVSMGFTAAEVERLLAKVMEGTTKDLPLSSAMVMAVPQLNVEPPVRPEPVLRRAHLEQQVVATHSSRKAVLLRGDAGSGRTELARSATEDRPRVHWLDLHANRYLSPEAALELFLGTPSSVADGGSPNPGSQDGVLKSATLIIDNVDDPILRPEFEARVRALAAKAADGPSLILISLHPLPRSVAPLFEDIEVKRLDNGEVRQLMRLYGAPKAAFQDGLVNLVEGVTHGMPDLVSLLLRDWHSKDWQRNQRLPRLGAG